MTEPIGTLDDAIARLKACTYDERADLHALLKACLRITIDKNDQRATRVIAAAIDVLAIAADGGVIPQREACA